MTENTTRLAVAGIGLFGRLEDATVDEFDALIATNGRVGNPDEIADAIAALASSDLRWVTGERLEVSGGSLL